MPYLRKAVYVVCVASNIPLRDMSPYAWTRDACYDESLHHLPCPRKEVHEVNLLRISNPHAFPLGQLSAIVLITEERTTFGLEYMNDVSIHEHIEFVFRMCKFFVFGMRNTSMVTSPHVGIIAWL